PQALEREKRGVSLVQVPDAGSQAGRLERPRAADPEQELLAEPVLAVAAVEPVADRAGPRRLALEVGVQQIELDTGDASPPDLRRDHGRRSLVVSHLDLDAKREAL